MDNNTNLPENVTIDDLSLDTFSMPKPEKKDILFSEDWVEDYGFAFQKSICTFYLGKYQESIEACNALIENPHLPESWKEQALENKKYPLEKLAERVE